MRWIRVGPSDQPGAASLRPCGIRDSSHIRPAAVWERHFGTLGAERQTRLGGGPDAVSTGNSAGAFSQRGSLGVTRNRPLPSFRLRVWIAAIALTLLALWVAKSMRDSDAHVVWTGDAEQPLAAGGRRKRV